MSAAPIPGSDRVLVGTDRSVSTVLGATERLNQSRHLLRECMQAINAAASDMPANSHRPRSTWLVTLTAIPVLGPVIESVSAWWAQHPLRVVASVFASSTATAAKPMTQTRPWSVLLMAVAIGGLLAWTRPWRFAWLRRAVYAGVLPQLVSTVMSRLPTEGWLDIVNSLLRRPGATSSASQTTTSTTAGAGPTERPTTPQPTSSHDATRKTMLH